MLHRPKSFKMPHWPIPRGNNDIRLGLDRILSLLNRVGNPHLQLPPVIHIAGTNGKGSTIAYLQAILQSAGYSVHKYISPHLIDFNERIILNGEKITDEMLFQIGEECRYASESDDIPTTFFEGVTAIAFLAFSRVPADVLLLEVGMGGRLDATNIIPHSVATVITSISFDHMEYLGSTIGQIAEEKAGIIKRDGFCVCSWQTSEAKNILLQRTMSLGCERYMCGNEWNFVKHLDDTFSIKLVSNELAVFANTDMLHLSQPSLVGLHQYINASTAAVTALKLSADSRFKNINQQHISDGIQQAIWPGRMQKITGGVLASIIPKNFEIWLDGAHNEGGVQMIVTSLQDMKPKGILYVIHGRTRHRDMAVFLQHFIDIVELVCCVEIISEPDSEDPYEIQACCKNLNISAIVSDSVKDATLQVVQYHSDKYHDVYGRIIICGSLYLAGDVLLANRGG